MIRVMLDNAAQLPTMMMSIFKILTCVKYLLNMKIAGLVPEGASFLVKNVIIYHAH
jgi:hypothetical protein